MNLQATIGKTVLRLLIAAALGLCLSSRADEERLWVDAKINGHPVKLAFDSAAEMSFLFRPTAENLGLRVTNWPVGKQVAPGKVAYGCAESCELSVWGLTGKATFAVLDFPDAVAVGTKLEGVLGWPVWKRSILFLDCLNQRFKTLPRMPPEFSSWPKFNLQPDSGILILEVPDKGGQNVSIMVDTANAGGVSLAPQLWKEWTSAHPNRKRTLDAYYLPGAGLRVQEESWADELSIGSLVVRDVPVREAVPAEMVMARSKFGAAFGLAALKRLELVVDGSEGVVYVRTNASPPVPYTHNRAGAVFIPEDLEKSAWLVARVLPGSPAYVANVRDGDVLLKTDGLDASKWRTDLTVRPNSRFCDRLAGRKVRLVLRREGREFQTEITLRDMIGPESVAKDSEESAK